MTIFNTFARGSANKIGYANPQISNITISSNTSSIILNFNLSAGKYSTGTITAIPRVASSVGYNGLGCHAILNNLGYSGPTLFRTSNYGTYGSSSGVGLYGLYYDSDYDITITIDSGVGVVDTYTVRASTAVPDDIILTGNTNTTGVSLDYTNLNGTQIVIPRNIYLGSSVLVGGGGGGGGNSLSTLGAGGGGGGLAWANGLAFLPGSLLTYSVAGSGYYNTAGGSTYISNTTYLFAAGGSQGQAGGSTNMVGGGGGAGGYNLSGGNGGSATTVNYAGGGGGGGNRSAAAGYNGSFTSGGNGGASTTGIFGVTAPTSPGSGSPAGGTGGQLSGYGGGGVGLYGSSSVDDGGFTTSQGGATAANGLAASAHNGGSGGSDGTYSGQSGLGGGKYGGGAPGFGIGGKGAMRICFYKQSDIRAFPSTNVSTVRTNTTHQIDY